MKGRLIKYLSVELFAIGFDRAAHDRSTQILLLQQIIGARESRSVTQIASEV